MLNYNILTIVIFKKPAKTKRFIFLVLIQN